MLVLVVAAIVGTIALIEFRFNTASQAGTQAQVTQPTTGETMQEPNTTQPEKTTRDPEPTPDKPAKPENTAAEQAQSTPEPNDEAERIAKKEQEFKRAAEITGPTGYINTDGVSLEGLRGEKVVLVEFWTYTCYNCQNAQPYINGFHEEYADDGLQVIGVHSPEFEFEKDYNNVAAAVQEAGIQYPVVLDNNYATWNAYNNIYWPASYLIDADGFIRYKHFGEGAYAETEKKIQELLDERDRT
jgi:thiol-disulfide isomerase/thioredoxin